MTDVPEKIRQAVNAVESRDPKLREEMESKRSAPPVEPEMAEGAFGDIGFGPPPELVRETIVLRTGRPVLSIVRDEAQLQFSEPESEIWRERLRPARQHLVRAAQAVGRVELENNPRFDWVGTGWLVQPDVLVTNRHVASEFGRRGSSGFVFRAGTGGRDMGAFVDFLEEFGRPEDLTFRLTRILHIEDENGPDLAFLKVAPADGRRLAAPIPLATAAPALNRFVAVIGYPARDSRIPEPPLMTRIFGDVFDKKRLAPGQLTHAAPTVIQHDCSTLGGNSGSLIVDLQSGEAVGVHFAGRFLEANFAVPAAVVAERMRNISREGAAFRPAPPAATQSPVQTQPSTPAGSAMSWTIPLRVSVELGPPEVVPAGQTAAQTTAVSPAVAPPRPAEEPGDDDEVLDVEARPEDYRDRTGYDPAFLGHGLEAPLPEIRSGADQVVTFSVNGDTESVLKYEHFSVIMHRARRMCFYSAVNINGGEARRTSRPGWRRDPRIPEELQILRECYGNPPKFSRGHMTRREDPAWGDRNTADLGNADSMHVTNAVPQVQVFNAGVWLGLEDFALQNAKRDEMKICVITGPFFTPQDPVRFGVKIPRTFWKVIAFIHDETDELSATGYTMSQASLLREEEFVFGRYETHQRSIASIEQRAGVSFGSLTAADRFGRDEEAPEAPLTSFSQIRFV